MNLFEWTLQQIVNAQLEILSANQGEHLLELVSEKIIGAGAISTLEAAERIGRRVTIAGVP